MIIIRNNIIPFPGFKAINLCGILFVRRSANMSDADIRHEAIHTAQMKELFVAGFYLWYVVEWLIRLFLCLNAHKAYRQIAFEQEAYGYQQNAEYLSHRPIFNWLKYL